MTTRYEQDDVTDIDDRAKECVLVEMSDGTVWSSHYSYEENAIDNEEIEDSLHD